MEPRGIHRLTSSKYGENILIEPIFALAYFFPAGVGNNDFDLVLIFYKWS